MTKTLKKMPLFLMLSAAIMSTVFLASSVRADSEQVKFAEPVTVGGTVLKPDTYTLSWSGTGPDVIVSFMRDNKTVATVPAKLVMQHNPERSIRSHLMDDNSTRVLQEIRFKHKSLIFG